MPFAASAEQTQIITAPPDARILIDAEAGAGKTEVVARRIAHLLTGGLKPGEILVLSFSRAAVRVLTERLRTVAAEDSSVEELRWATVRTFDSWAFRLLRQLGHEPAKLLAADFNRNIELTLRELKDGHRVLTHPEANLGRLRHLIVDEMQDLTSLRAQLVRRLLEILAPPAESARGFTLLGDSCQAIYGWAEGSGKDALASADVLAWVRRTYGGALQQLPLTSNRRATKAVAKTLEAARLCLIAAGGEAKASGSLAKLRQVRDSLPVETAPEIAAAIAAGSGKSYAVLCRDNGQVLRVAQALSKEWGAARPQVTMVAGAPPRTIPSWIGRLLSEYEGSQISRAHFEKLFSRIDRALPAPSNAATAWRMLLRFARMGAADTALSLETLRERVSWPDSLPDDESEGATPVLLTTIHQSKGREFDCIRLLATDPDGTAEPSEEARVIYVGLTRARSELACANIAMYPLFQKDCRGGRKRWHRWNPAGNGTFHHLELGRDGDMDDSAIIQTTVLESKETVGKVQGLLATEESALIGLEVKATKVMVSQTPLKVAYRLYAAVPSRGEVCLGQFSDAVRQDIHSVLSNGQGLPKNIYGLRIAAVTTCVTKGTLPADVPPPWQVSRIWLGITVHGLAQFKTFWRA